VLSEDGARQRIALPAASRPSPSTTKQHQQHDQYDE